MKRDATLILGVTASIAIYKACDLVRRFKSAGFSVHVVMTPEAAVLVNPLVFQSLSGNRVYHDLFAQPDAWEIEHVALADKADLILIAPATAHCMAKVAAGLCDDMLSCVICASKAPVLLAPAMNAHMWSHPVTQENKKKLESLGYRFIGPVRGVLACGKEGVGCLADNETIVREVIRVAPKK